MQCKFCCTIQAIKSDASWPYTNVLLLLLLSLLSKVYCLDVAKVFKNVKVVFENLIWHRNQQKPLGMCLLLLHVAHTLWKYTTSLLHKFMYPWHEILSPKKNMGIIWRLSTFCWHSMKTTKPWGWVSKIHKLLTYIKVEFMKFTMGIDPLSSSITIYKK